MPADVDPEIALRELLGRIAPGTALRDGLERILAGRTGALIVLGYDRVVESLCTGGFALDVALSATRLRELAKMDGAVIVSYDGTRIVRAGAAGEDAFQTVAQRGPGGDAAEEFAQGDLGVHVGGHVRS